MKESDERKNWKMTVRREEANTPEKPE